MFKRISKLLDYSEKSIEGMGSTLASANASLYCAAITAEAEARKTALEAIGIEPHCMYESLDDFVNKRPY